MSLSLESLSNNQTPIIKETESEKLWTKEGKQTSQDEKKLRLLITGNSRIAIAVENLPTDSTRLKKAWTWITHVSVKDKNGKEYNLNINSLSNKVGLSCMKILLKKATGQLNFDYVHKKAQQIENYHYIMTNASKHNEIGTKEMAKMISDASKSNKLAKGVFYTQSQGSYIFQKDKGGLLKAIKVTRDVLGKGGCSIVYAGTLVSAAQPENIAVKIAKDPTNGEAIQNTYHILTKLTKDAKEEGIQRPKGIQRPPYCVCDLQISSGGSSKFKKEMGYISPQFAYSLNDDRFLNGPVTDKVIQSLSLVEGLNFLHSHNIVHGDLKPGNFCYDEDLKECQLADFDGASEIKNIPLNNPLGMFTPYFTAASDKKEAKNIRSLYSRACKLVKISQGKIKGEKAIKILIQCLNTPEFKFNEQDVQLIRLHIASIAYEVFKGGEYEEEINNLCEDLNLQKQVDISNLANVARSQLEPLHQMAGDLRKEHDIYSLGKSLLCIYIGAGGTGHNRARIPLPSTPAEIRNALKDLSQDPDLVSVNPRLTNLLTSMLSENLKDRPTSAEVMQEYKEIVEELTKHPAIMSQT